MVTREGSNKERIFRDALPDWHIHRRDPSFNEPNLEAIAPRDESRTVFIAEAKAREDAAMVAALCGTVNLLTEGAEVTHSEKGELYIYNDTEQHVHLPDGSLVVLDKPEGDPVEWAMHSPDAMIQSGNNVEIITALSGMLCNDGRVSEPKSVIVRVAATMRDFTREELVEYAKGSGSKTIPDTAGGISMANGGRSFYDTGKPLTVSVQDSLESEPVELLHFNTWAHVPDAALKPFICGAFEPALTRLVEKSFQQLTH